MENNLLAAIKSLFTGLQQWSRVLRSSLMRMEGCSWVLHYEDLQEQSRFLAKDPSMLKLVDER